MRDRHEREIPPLDRILNRLTDEARNCEFMITRLTERLTEVGEYHKPVIEDLLMFQQRELEAVNEELDAFSALLPE